MTVAGHSVIIGAARIGAVTTHGKRSFFSVGAGAFNITGRRDDAGHISTTLKIIEVTPMPDITKAAFEFVALLLIFFIR